MLLGLEYVHLVSRLQRVWFLIMLVVRGKQNSVGVKLYVHLMNLKHRGSHLKLLPL